jgi:aspartyl-tRNA(Asn)/glutamyl-tRNA(Gln) amidotransferase subunit A
MATLADLTLVEAADAVRNGDATSRELLESCWKRMEAVNPRLNATIWTDREGAAAAAASADARRGSAASPGALLGVPLAHKDMYYQAGKRCTCGSRLRAEFVPDRTATVIERLSGAGAYTFAGLNMAEFAQNPTGHNREFGDCHNPWNLPHITGGSSSGSGAAVAARFVYAALGSDTGGSIRLPASACGVTGLKPTQTRVSRYGAMPLSFTLDNVGPLARTARDCARVMSVIAGRDPKDPTSSHLPVPDYERALDGDVRSVRIGLPTNHFFDGADSRVTAAVVQAVEVLRARGATVVRLTLPLMDAVTGYGGIISRVEAAAIHAEWMRHRPQDYAPHLSARIYSGYAIPAPYYVESLSRRGPVLRDFAAAVFTQVDVLATPTIRSMLPTLAETDIDNGPPGTEKKFMVVSANTRPFNYLGLPAISIPCGFDTNGCPIGLQLAGRPFGEPRLLRVADAYQRDTAWHAMQPPVLRDVAGSGILSA